MRLRYGHQTAIDTQIVLCHAPSGKSPHNTRRCSSNKRRAPAIYLQLLSAPADQPSRERKAGNTSLRRRRLDRDARNVGWSDPSSTENSTGIISFIVTLPFKSFSTRTSCL